MYAVKRPKLVVALALLNVAATLLAALIGARVLQRGVLVPHDLCRAPIRNAAVSLAHGGASAVPVTAQMVRCTVAAPLAIPTPGYELLDNRGCR
jgi:hypothetical protein